MSIERIKKVAAAWKQRVEWIGRKHKEAKSVSEVMHYEGLGLQAALDAVGHVDELMNDSDRLREAIKKVLTQRGDDICWRDVYTDLAKLVGIEFTPELICDPAQHLANCERFISSLQQGPYVPVFVEKGKVAGE